MRTISNQKYEITDMAHEEYPFLHRIRALRDICGEIRAGDIGGFVESESNLSAEPGDCAWIFDDAIAAGDAYVDRDACLRGDAIACGSAYVSKGSVMSGHSRAEDNAYLRGASMTGKALASGNAQIIHDPHTMGTPILSGNCKVYGTVQGDIRITGSAVILPCEEVRNDTRDTFVLSGKSRSVIRGIGRETLKPLQKEVSPIAAQETLLGIYRKNGAEKIVVACKDFTSPGIVLQDFASLKNTVINSGHSGYGTELSDITQAMEDQTAFPPALLKQHFWDMFIVDALIGNWDRHNGNWGFLYNTMTDEIHLAPVYDCGSSLYPQADESIMRNTLESQKEQDLRTFSLPLSGIKINGQRINYFNFISSLSYPDCNAALKRILPRINMEQVFAIIDETPFASDLQKQFYKTMLQARKERILDFSMRKLEKRERSAHDHDFER